jgi:hypothetical protein
MTITTEARREIDSHIVQTPPAFVANGPETGAAILFGSLPCGCEPDLGHYVFKCSDGEEWHAYISEGRSAKATVHQDPVGTPAADVVLPPGL